MARPPVDGLRRVAGLPVPVAAERLGVSRSTVKRWRRQIRGCLAIQTDWSYRRRRQNERIMGLPVTVYLIEWRPLMIVVRNVFQLKFGKAKEAVPLAKEALAIQQKALAGVDFSTRLLTDVTGPFYTLVLELTVPSLATWETNAPRVFADKDFQANYQKMAPLVESGHREVFTVVD